MDITPTPQSNVGGVQPQQVQPTQSQGQSLDPSIVALTKAIGQAETPKQYGTPAAYTTPSGDPGSPASAYQFTPGFIDKWGPSVLGSQYQKGNYNLTPAQQDQLAYGAIKTMGTTGDPMYEHLGKLTPQQIASDWNSGDPNAYQESAYQGTQTNSSGQKYNLLNYVSTVEKNYNKLNPQSQTASNPIIPSANAASSGSGDVPSGSGPSVTDWILGGSAAALAWLGTNAWKYAQKPIKDAVIDTALGTIIEPGGGTAVGAVGGVLQGIAEDIIGGTGDSTQTSSETPADSTYSGATSGTTTPTAIPQTTQPNKVQYTPEAQPTREPSQPLAQELEADMPMANRESQRVAKGVANDYAATVGGRKAMTDPNVQGGIEEIGMNGFAPEVTEDDMGNHINNYQLSISRAQEMTGDVSKSMEQMLNVTGKTGSMRETIDDAERDFNMKHGIDASERAAAKEYMQKKGEDYLKEGGDGNGNMMVGHFEKMKRELGHGKKWDMTTPNWKNEADKSMSAAARRTVEKNVTPEVKELYNRANKKMQRLINAKQIMEKLDQKKGRKNPSFIKKLVNAGGRYAAMYIGDKIGGALGAILGSMVGDFVTRSVDKKFGKTIFESPAMRKGLEILQKQHPQSYTILENELKKAGILTPKMDMADLEKQNMKQDVADFTTHPSSTPTQKAGLVSRQPAGKAPVKPLQSRKLPPRSR